MLLGLPCPGIPSGAHFLKEYPISAPKFFRSMNITTRPSVRIQRCPYLGLHDDDSTSLAYASPWNYCYHAAPPASVLVSHQAEVCLGDRHADCPVMLSNRWGRLPRPLRGKVEANLQKNGSSSWLLRLGVFLLLAIVLMLILFFYPYFLL